MVQDGLYPSIPNYSKLKMLSNRFTQQTEKKFKNESLIVQDGSTFFNFQCEEIVSSIHGRCSTFNNIRWIWDCAFLQGLHRESNGIQIEKAETRTSKDICH